MALAAAPAGVSIVGGRGLRICPAPAFTLALWTLPIIFGPVAKITATLGLTDAPAWADGTKQRCIPRGLPTSVQRSRCAGSEVASPARQVALSSIRLTSENNNYRKQTALSAAGGPPSSRHALAFSAISKAVVGDATPLAAYGYESNESTAKSEYAKNIK